MKKININVVLCQQYDERTQSFIGIINRIELDKKTRKQPIRINIVTFLSGYGDELKPDFSLDYYMKCVKDKSSMDDEESFSDKISYLFSMRMHEDKENQASREETDIPASYQNTFQNIGQLEKKILLPCEGRFEVQVFLNDIEEKDPVDRYQKYMDGKKSPLSVYYFDVIDNETNLTGDEDY